MHLKSDLIRHVMYFYPNLKLFKAQKYFKNKNT